MQNKTCLECAKPLLGRSDKRFCDDSCRNAYNNRLNSTQSKSTRNISRILLKNRRILADKLGEEKMVKINREKLIGSGFDFIYHTHSLLTQKGHQYIFVFEYGYLSLENKMVLIVKNKEI